MNVAKMRTDNHVIDVSMATANSAEGYRSQDISRLLSGQHSSTVPVNEGAAVAYPTVTRSHTQALPARPPLGSRHAHTRSEPSSDMSDSRRLVE